jgi:antibiotic biosynthesis monooxygenase (ABM) superfamily enzyme
MVYFFIPLSTHLLAGWLNTAPQQPLPATPTTQNQ